MTTPEATSQQETGPYFDEKNWLKLELDAETGTYVDEDYRAELCLNTVEHSEHASAVRTFDPESGSLTLGVHLDDMLQMLEYMDPDHNRDTAAEKILSYWEDVPEISVTLEEDGTLLARRSVNEEGLHAYGMLIAANSLEVALAIAGEYGKSSQTRETLVENPMFAHLIRSATDVDARLSNSEFDTARNTDEIDHKSVAELAAKANAINLRELPLFMDSLNNPYLPVDITLDGEQLTGADVSVHPGLENTVHLYISWNDGYADGKEADFEIELRGPADTPITTIGALELVKSGRVKIYRNPAQENAEADSRELDLSITSTDHTLTIDSNEGLTLKVQEPQCDSCELPEWQFAELFEDDQDLNALSGVGNGVVMRYGSSTRNNRMHHMPFLYSQGDGDTICCTGCLPQYKEAYAAEIPAARIEFATNVALDALVMHGFDTNTYTIDEERVTISYRDDEGMLTEFIVLEQIRNGNRLTTRRKGRAHVSEQGAVLLDI